MSNLIIVKDNELYVSTWELSLGFGVDHRYIKKTVDKYKTEFLEFGINVVHNVNYEHKTAGRPIDAYLLNEEQASYLTMLMKNAPKVREFKRFLNKSFFTQRKLLQNILSQRINLEWQQKRDSGKIDRRIETDAIMAFIEYATSQGSKSAKFYYPNISKMENAALFMDLLKHKFENLRDVVNGFALTALQMADKIVAKALKEGMEMKMFYKDIYKMAKERVETFASVIGRTPIEHVLGMNVMKEISKEFKE